MKKTENPMVLEKREYVDNFCEYDDCLFQKFEHDHPDKKNRHTVSFLTAEGIDKRAELLKTQEKVK